MLQDCICFMVKSIFIGQQLSQLVPSWTFFCEKRRDTCSFVFSWPTYCHVTPPAPLEPPPHTQTQTQPNLPPKKSTSSGACKDVYNVFIFFLCEKIQISSPSPFSRPSGVCVKCTLPWFFFIQYSVTCLCKFGLEKNKSFYETICTGNSLMLWSGTYHHKRGTLGILKWGCMYIQEYNLCMAQWEYRSCYTNLKQWKY